MSCEGSVNAPTHPSTESTMAVARALLGRMLGFRDCPAAALDALANAGQIRKLDKGETLLQRGTRFDWLSVLVEGSLEISAVRSDGHRHLLSFLQPGDVAGLMSLLDGQPHSNDIIARKPTCLLMVPGDQVRPLRATYPCLIEATETQLVFRSRLLYERLSADTSIPLDGRLARLLHIYGRLYGHERGGEVLLDMKLSQSDLADLLGVSRQSVNAAVNQLVRASLIRLSYSTVTITDLTGLATYSAR